MEFESNKPVGEAERQLAQTPQMVIQPIHADVAPDDLPAEAIAATHLSVGAIANAPGDIEQEARPLQPLASATPTAKIPHLSIGHITLTITGLVLFALVVIFIIFQK